MRVFRVRFLLCLCLGASYCSAWGQAPSSSGEQADAQPAVSPSTPTVQTQSDTPAAAPDPPLTFAGIHLSGMVDGYYGFNNNTNRFQFHVGRVGVNYRFNWGVPAPVVARY